MRLEDGDEGKININTHFEGWQHDGGNLNERICEGVWWMFRIGCGLGTWNGRILWEEDEVEFFGSLNVNFNFCSTLESLKRDFGTHIFVGLLSFLFDDVEIISAMMDFGTHTCLIIFSYFPIPSMFQPHLLWIKSYLPFFLFIFLFLSASLGISF